MRFAASECYVRLCGITIMSPRGHVTSDWSSSTYLKPSNKLFARRKAQCYLASKYVSSEISRQPVPRINAFFNADQRLMEFQGSVYVRWCYVRAIVRDAVAREIYRISRTYVFHGVFASCEQLRVKNEMNCVFVTVFFFWKGGISDERGGSNVRIWNLKLFNCCVNFDAEIRLLGWNNGENTKAIWMRRFSFVFYLSVWK